MLFTATKDDEPVTFKNPSQEVVDRMDIYIGNHPGTSRKAAKTAVLKMDRNLSTQYAQGPTLHMAAASAEQEAQSESFSQDDGDDDGDEDTETAVDKLTRLARDEVEKNGVKFRTASQTVLRRNPNLAVRVQEERECAGCG